MMKIAIIGDLIDSDLVLGEIISRQNIEVAVFRHKSSAGAFVDLSASFYTRLNKKNMNFFSNPFELLFALRKYSFIYSITSSLFFKLRYFTFIYPLLILAGWPKYMVVCSGSNITERAVEWSIGGIIERFSLRHAFCIMLNNYPTAINNAIRLGLQKCIFLPFPYKVTLSPQRDTEFSLNKENRQLLFFHASNLDWGKTDSSFKRRSTKGNDRFIRAFIKACKNGLNAKCLILERGSDSNNAKRLIQEYCGENFFIWKEGLSREEFHKEIVKYDIVVDQFDMGGYGGIAVEALDYGKPVLIYINEECNSLLFDNDIPVLNAFSEEDIERRLFDCQDGSLLRKLSKLGKELVKRYFDPVILGKRYLLFAELASKTKRINYFDKS